MKYYSYFLAIYICFSVYVYAQVDFVEDSFKTRLKDSSFQIGLDYVLWDKFYFGTYSKYFNVKVLLDNLSMHSAKLNSKLDISSHSYIIFGLGVFRENSFFDTKLLLGVEYQINANILCGLERLSSQNDQEFNVYISYLTRFRSLLYSVVKPMKKSENKSRVPVSSENKSFDDFNKNFDFDIDDTVRSPG